MLRGRKAMEVVYQRLVTKYGIEIGPQGRIPTLDEVADLRLYFWLLQPAEATVADRWVAESLAAIGARVADDSSTRRAGGAERRRQQQAAERDSARPLVGDGWAHGAASLVPWCACPRLRRDTLHRPDVGAHAKHACGRGDGGSISLLLHNCWMKRT